MRDGHAWDAEGYCPRCGTSNTEDWHGSTCDEMLAFHTRQAEALKENEAATLAAASTSLKPCPFCGGEAEVRRAGTIRRSTIIECTDCGCSLESNEHSHWIGSQWNTRHLESGP